MLELCEDVSPEEMLSTKSQMLKVDSLSNTFPTLIFLGFFVVVRLDLKLSVVLFFCVCVCCFDLLLIFEMFSRCD